MYNIAVITSRFNEEVTEKLFKGATQYFQEHKNLIKLCDNFWVPGAVELPLFAQRLALTQKYDAILILGAIILGETDHYTYVCQQVSFGCQEVALKHNIPVIFGVLTCQNETLALERVGGKSGDKGYECAKTLVDMLSELEKV